MFHAEVKSEVFAGSENEKEYQSDACDTVFIDQRNFLPFTEIQKDEKNLEKTTQKILQLKRK